MKSVKGSLKVANDVIADLAGYAAMSCYGVVGMLQPHVEQHLHLLMRLGQLRNGVEVHLEDGTLVVTLHVVVEANVNMHSVSENLVSAVQFMLKQIAEIDDVDVRVVIEAIK